MIPYIGGKNYIASWIIDNFPTDYPKMAYVEVFGGGGWILFKKEPSNLETYNDLNSDLVNLFNVIRDSYPEFEHRAQWSLHSREMYQEAISKLQQDEFLGKVEKAMHYALRRMQTFSASNSKSWGYAVSAPKVLSGKWLPFLRRLEYINARLKRVQIENLDFEKLILKYDEPGTLFYLDPPYVEAEKYYNTREVFFTREDHLRLNGLLKSLKGKFCLSYYDHPLVRELYGGYNIIKKATVKHSSGSVGNKRSGYVKPKAVELLIMNY